MIRRALTVGSLVTVLPGVYAPATLHAHRDATAIGRAVAATVLPGLAAGSVLSHVSAAAVHGLRVPAAAPVVVHITRPPPAKSRRGRSIWVHRGILEPDEVDVVDDLVVTSPVRTVIDCARTMAMSDGQALVRDAVDAGLVTGTALHDGLRRRPRAPGARTAAEVLLAAIPPP
jgi:predicted transcriptional regulator of viral defense system